LGVHLMGKRVLIPSDKLRGLNLCPGVVWI